MSWHPWELGHHSAQGKVSLFFSFVTEASLVAQLVKNLPAMRETWVGKIPWRRERLPTPVFWPGEFPHKEFTNLTRKESDTTEQLSLTERFIKTLGPLGPAQGLQGTEVSGLAKDRA